MRTEERMEMVQKGVMLKLKLKLKKFHFKFTTKVYLVRFHDENI